MLQSKTKQPDQTYGSNGEDEQGNPKDQQSVQYQKLQIQNS